MNPLQNLITNYLRSKRRFDMEKRNLEVNQQRLTEYLSENKIKTTEVQQGNEIVTATYVQASRFEVDEEGLKNYIGEKRFNGLCKQVLDKSVLEAAMECGDLDPEHVGKFITERKNKPSVRVSARAAETALPSSEAGLVSG